MERKSKSIILRATRKEKDSLMREAKKKNMTLSRYLVQSGLEGTHEKDGIPLYETIERNDFLNELYHRVMRCGDEQLKTDIAALYQEKFNTLWREEQ